MQVSGSDPWDKQFETTPKEEEFHNATRVVLVTAFIFFTLYAASHTLIKRFRRKASNDEYFPDDDDGFVYRIPLWLCNFSLATSFGAMILLPFSIFTNEFLLAYPKNYYMQWLSSSLVHGLWNCVFFFSNISLYILLPFAYLFTESEGLPHKKGLAGKVYETTISLTLLSIVIVALVIVGAAILNMTDQSDKRTMDDIVFFYFPMLYSVMSFIGTAFHLICTPIGFATIFTVMGRIITKPQSTKDLEDAYLVNQFIVADINRKLEYNMENKLLNGYSPEKMYHQLEQTRKEQRQIDRTLKMSHWRLYLGYPLAMIILLLLTAASVFMISINVFGLLVGTSSLPFVESEDSTSLGKDSLSQLGLFGAAIEIILIIYFMLSSLLGFYNLPLLNQLLPKDGDTPLHKIILNCVTLLVLSSALPLFVRTLGLTKFDLLGNFGRLNWLKSFSIVLVYNVSFAIATGWCLANKVTHTLCKELYFRYRVACFQIRRWYTSVTDIVKPLFRRAVAIHSAFS